MRIASGTRVRASTARAAMLLAVTAALSACVTNIKPTVAYNPPPEQALASFGRYELRPVELGPAVERSAANEAALAKIQQNIDQRVTPVLVRWSLRDHEGPTLVITPRIEELKFVGGGKRFFAGALAGSSAVRMTVEMRTHPGDALIASPQFYQRAAAYGGAWSVGGTDNAMLVRIATVMQEYLERNAEQAVGGPTGLEASQQ